MKHLSFLTVLILAAIFGYGSGGDVIQAAEKVRVGIPSRSALWWPHFVAEDKKFYEAEGFALETVLIQGGAARAVQILTAGDLDFVTAGTISSLTAYLKGSPIVFVSGLINDSPFQVYAAPEIQSVKDLKGKAIASGGPGGPPHFVATVVLQAAGLDPKRDIRQFAIPGANNRIIALEQRQVHAAVLSPPFSFRAIELGFKKIADARDYLKEDQNDGITTVKGMVQKNPEKIRRFLRALVKGMRFIPSNRDESIRILGKYTQQPLPILEKTYDFMVPTISEKISERGMEAIYRYLVDSGIVFASADMKDFVDDRFLPRGQ
jgi:NitT/TauT family transport system substrate-binding protein